jgi:hypothetical protein
MWPFNRGWPLNGGPLNRGSTVLRVSIKYTLVLKHIGYCMFGMIFVRE